MSAHGRGPYLWLRPARYDDGKLSHPPTWLILDGSRQRSTRCGIDDSGGAERKLAEYIAEKHVSAATQGERHPSQVPVASVIALYAANVLPRHARPLETKSRLKTLLGFFGTRRLSEINGTLCRSYVASRTSPLIARRELEELRAAINYHRKEGGCSHIVSVSLPERGQARDRWLTRSEAARLLWTAWMAREKQGAVATDRRPWRHIARFILVALYTGSRSAAVVTASFERQSGRGWIDTTNGVFHRKRPARASSKKKQPPIPLPEPLWAHMKRWEDMGLTGPVEWRGESVERISRGFRKVAKMADLEGVTPHTLRHTAATWLMQGSTDAWTAGGFLGMTVETISRVYGHHHTDHLRGALAGFQKHRQRSAKRTRDQEANERGRSVE